MFEVLLKVKRAIGISHRKKDADILDDIAACLDDLRQVGISVPDEIPEQLDPTLLRAVKLFCKGHYTEDPAKSERFLKLYDDLKGSLMSTTGYGFLAEDLSDE